jgi:surfactin synthase thioesterase subunit
VRSRRDKNRIVSLESRDAGRCALFCFHHAGGGGAVFRSWQRLFGPWIEVVPVVLPGRAGSVSRPPITDFTLAVERICAEIEPLTVGPYALFGHSLGAALAFEVACKLERSATRAPSCIIVSGRGAPHVQNADAEPPSSTLPDSELVAKLSRFGGTPREIIDSPEMLKLLLPIIRADFRLAESYSWDGRSMTTRPLLVLGGMGDRFAGAAELERWRELTSGPATIRMFEGGHFFIATQAADTCAAITTFLERSAREQITA